jgi:hypothetical protein
MSALLSPLLDDVAVGELLIMPGPGPGFLPWVAFLYI